MSKETDELNARIERLEKIAGLKGVAIRKAPRGIKKQTIEDRARDKLREYLPPAELVEFEKAAAELDALNAELHATKDKEAAHDLAYRLVADTSALFAIEIPLLERIGAEVAVLWQQVVDQLGAANALKKEAVQDNKDVIEAGGKLPLPHPSQTKEERDAQIAPIVAARTERLRKSREDMMATLHQINADTKDLKKQDKELHIEHARIKGIVEALKTLPDTKFPLPPPRRAALHDPSKPVFVPDMSPSERMHASGTHYADRWVKGMK